MSIKKLTARNGSQDSIRAVEGGGEEDDDNDNDDYDKNNFI
jgi:hypothetical protein